MLLIEFDMLLNVGVNLVLNVGLQVTTSVRIENIMTACTRFIFWCLYVEMGRLVAGFARCLICFSDSLCAQRHWWII